MSILIRPIITEKMTGISEKLNRYGFIVDPKSNKFQIKQAVEELYNVKVTDVNTLNQSGKKKTRYSKTTFISGRKNNLKKAVISLADGQTIDFFSNI